MTGLARRVLREPLTHFAIIGALLGNLALMTLVLLAGWSFPMIVLVCVGSTVSHEIAALVLATREDIAKQCGIPGDCVMIGASHSHSSGPIGMVQPGEFEDARPHLQFPTGLCSHIDLWTWPDGDRAPPACE